MDSILTSIKKLLGIDESYEHFDLDIIMHINTVFMVLAEIGVGPAKGFAIKDKTAVWSDFLPKGDLRFEGVKTYMYLKVRLIFDPPSSTAVLESMNRYINELEVRLNHAAEHPIEEEEN